MVPGNDDSPGPHRDPRRVRAVYDDIASHFAKTRAYPWPEVSEFVESVPRGAGLGLDLGCGNGRHSSPLAAVTDRALGVDLSRGLLAEAVPAAGDEVSFLQADASAIPVTDGCVDVAAYVATLHHLPDRETRVASLRELRRVLAPGGRALVSAWSSAHEQFDADPTDDTGFDTTVDWTLPDGETVPRFYHIYTRPEFEADIEAAGLALERSFLSSGNCYAVCRPAG